MAIPLSDQYTLAMVQPEFRSRITSAMMSAAITAFSATPNADPVTQTNRVQLASEILASPTKYTTAFGWIVVTRPAVSSLDSLTDTFVSTTVSQVFDPAANQLVGSS